MSQGILTKSPWRSWTLEQQSNRIQISSSISPTCKSHRLSLVSLLTFIKLCRLRQRKISLSLIAEEFNPRRSRPTTVNLNMMAFAKEVKYFNNFQFQTGSLGTMFKQTHAVLNMSKNDINWEAIKHERFAKWCEILKMPGSCFEWLGQFETSFFFTGAKRHH